jgi:hypothetical protein
MAADVSGEIGLRRGCGKVAQKEAHFSPHGNEDSQFFRPGPVGSAALHGPKRLSHALAQVEEIAPLSFDNRAFAFRPARMDAVAIGRRMGEFLRSAYGAVQRLRLREQEARLLLVAPASLET